ncbi:hypothetical protein L6V77_08935 [Myxococcota bacterium]|nr:hypothetical protein [Myxococcota bacterium]
MDAQRPPRLARWLNGRGERQALHVFDEPLSMISSSDVAIFERRWSAVQALLVESG